MNQPPEQPMTRPPLSGITVVSLEQAIAAPLASRHLADWGARVIKIERPGKGDFCRDYDYVMNGMSSQFAWTNRSKESLALDVKSDEGKKVLDALLPQADVFLQNLAPGAAKRLGLDAATLWRLEQVDDASSISGDAAHYVDAMSWVERFSREHAGLLMDFSRQRLDEIALAKLCQLADAAGLRERIDAMWRGERINTTEGRAVLHVALRQPAGAAIGGAEIEKLVMA